MPASAQTMASVTACSLKNSIRLPVALQSRRRRASARRFFYHKALAGGPGIRELEVREHLPEIPRQLLRHVALDKRQDCHDRVDPDLGLLQVATRLVELRVRD